MKLNLLHNNQAPTVLERVIRAFTRGSSHRKMESAFGVGDDAGRIKRSLEWGANASQPFKPTFVPGHHIDTTGCTPLFMAIHHGWQSIELIRLLLDAGADIDGKSRHGRTALHECAVQGADVSVAKFLLDAGADPLLVDELGKTALDLALDRVKIEKSRKESHASLYARGADNDAAAAALLESFEISASARAIAGANNGCCRLRL